MVKHRRVRPPKKALVDPIYRIPPGAEEAFGYSRDFQFVDEDSAEEVLITDFDEDSPESDASGLSTPTTFSIVSQTVRRAPGGAIRIDVVIEVEDIDGATNYEVQTAKV